MDSAAAHTKEIIERELKATAATAPLTAPDATPATSATATAASHSAVFNPEDLGLDASFTLTDFSALKGCGCKLPQAKLLGYLEDIANDLKPNETPGMDSSVVKISHGKDLYMISTTDFFFPSVEDPYIQGKIACANVLSDVYAMGVTEVDTMLMILGVCRDMSEKERDVVTTQMIRGFNDLARHAETNVTGGQTVMNPWPIVGGVAMSVRSEREIIRPVNAEIGDVVILTKPLGTQVAVNLWQWRKRPERWAKVAHVVTERDAADAFAIAAESMSRLNLNAARLMHKYGAHSATDVTGFGLLAHARNQAKSQTRAVALELHTLPVIAHMVAVNDALDNSFRLLDGFAAETSGGLLLCLPADHADAFIAELRALDNKPAWVVGRVVAGDRDAHIVPSPTILHVGLHD